MNRNFCLTLAMSLILIMLMAGTQFGCGDKPKKEEVKTSEKADKAPAEEMAMPFGGKEDVDFANMVWSAMKGYQDVKMKTDMIPGNEAHGDEAHGKFITIYYDVISVQEKPYHTIIKENFTPEKKLAAITVMVQREAGYDSDNNDWFWAKYAPDGTVSKNDKDMALAGRVAKGMPKGCIACHKGAKGKDYIFINDSEM